MKNKLFLTLLVPSFAMATGGYEKPVMWSARGAQVAGAYGASVSGAEAIAFNPAGLVQEKNELSLGGQVSWGSSKAPVTESEREKGTYLAPLVIPAVTYAHQLDNKNALGFGVQTSGGLMVKYQDTSYAFLGNEYANFRPDLYANLAIVEYALGWGHKVNENFSFGLALRAHSAAASFSQSERIDSGGVNLGVTNAELTNLKGTSFGQYRLGLKYLTDSKNDGWGLSYRSNLAMKLKGDARGKIIFSNAGGVALGVTAGQEFSLAGSDAVVESNLPEAIAFSGFHKFNPTNAIHYGYTWTRYSRNKSIKINARLTNIDSTIAEIQDVANNNHDMHDLMLGYTNTSIDKWTLGGGYSIASAASDHDAASPLATAPGDIHHLYLGAGRELDKWRVDVAGEAYWGMARGQTKPTATATSENPRIKGLYQLVIYGVNLSVSRYF